MKTEADLTDFLWAFVWVTGYKAHFVPKQLVMGIVQDLTSREHEEEGAGEVFEIKGVDAGFVDRPGMIMVDRPVEKIKIDTFHLDIPSQDFQYFGKKLLKAELRQLPDGQKYYKIHGWLHCVVFTPDQRDLVLKTMAEMYPEVESKAEKADKEFSRRMREINKNGVKVVSHRDKESPHVKRVRKPKGKPN
jgi:hypothetical protein